MSGYDIATVIIIAATPVAWIAWDVYLAVTHRKTESMFVADWARKANTLPFFCGVLMGHWFVQVSDPSYTRWPWALAVLGGVIGLDIVNAIKPLPKPLRHPAIWLLVGVATGAILWNQGWRP